METPTATTHFEGRTNRGAQVGHNYGSVTNNSFYTSPESTLPPWSSGNIHFLVDRPVNDLFTGRASILQRIESTLRERLTVAVPTSQCRVVITGVAGLGKSEICLHVANNLRHSYWGVFWVDVGDASQVEALFVATIQRIQKSTSTLQQAQRTLSNISYPWLLVLDNADDPNVDYQAFFPGGSYGHILMTSRNGECGLYATAGHEELGGLEGADARVLLLKTARLPFHLHANHEEEAELICSLLESHTLALIQAGSYVAAHHCTLAEYPRVHALSRQRLLQFHPVQARSRYGNVYAALEASQDVLRSSSQVGTDAQELLSMLSMLDHNFLPVQTFEAAWKVIQKAKEVSCEECSGFGLWLSERLVATIEQDKPSWDSFRLMSAFRLLSSLALVSVTTKDGTLQVSMHPLAHSWAKDRQDDLQQDQSWAAAACLITLSTYHRDQRRLDHEQLRPHILALLNRDMRAVLRVQPSRVVVEVLLKLVADLKRERPNQITGLLEEVFRVLELNPGKPCHGLQRLYVTFAYCLFQSGQFKRVITILEPLISLNEHYSNHKILIRLSQIYLILAYAADGDSEKGSKALKKAAEWRLQHLATSDHPQPLPLEQLVLLLSGNGNYETVKNSLENALEINKPWMLTDSLNFLFSRKLLAQIYCRFGRVNDAITTLEFVLRMEKEILGPWSIEALDSQASLANIYLRTNRPETAIQMLENVVRVQTQRLSAECPELRFAQVVLVLALSAQNILSQAGGR